jgi:hypothetical protein
VNVWAWIIGGGIGVAIVAAASRLGRSSSAAPTFSKSPTEARAGLMHYAYDVVRRLEPTWTDNAIVLAISDGWFESYLGGTGSFLLPNGTPSWNWGAVMARKGMAFFNHADHKPDGKPFTGGFAVFPSMEEGFKFWRKIMPAQSIAAMQTGDAYEMARAMFVAGYYSNVDDAPLGDPEGDKRRVQGYANALASTSKVVESELGLPANLVSSVKGSHGYVSPTGV